jgi:hypothetical protein
MNGQKLSSEKTEREIDKCITALLKKYNIKLSNKNRDKRFKEIIKHVLKNKTIHKKDLISYFVFKFGLSPKSVREDFVNQLVSIKLLSENAFGLIAINDLENSDEAVLQ